jgi:hypothetical protein
MNTPSILVAVLTAIASTLAVAQTPAAPKAVTNPPAKAAPKPSKVYPSPKAARMAAVSDAQKDAAARVYTGSIACEGGQKVAINPDPANPGYFDVTAGKFKMKAPATVTSTGVVRVEDPKLGIWLQAGNKSMLINTKIGQRVADGCMNDDQKRIAEGMVGKPKEDLFGTSPDAKKP